MKQAEGSTNEDGGAVDEGGVSSLQASSSDNVPLSQQRIDEDNPTTALEAAVIAAAAQQMPPLRHNHRRTQSTRLLSSSGDDTSNSSPTCEWTQRLLSARGKSASLYERGPASSRSSTGGGLKFYPGSHLLLRDNTGAAAAALPTTTTLYFSLWLLPPASLRPQLSQQIAKLSLRYNYLGSSAPFVPHVTLVGSIPCATLRDAVQLGRRLQKGLRHSGPVPCRFNNAANQPCQAMYSSDDDNNNDNDDNDEPTVVWSQACIAIMERSDEYMKLLESSRQLLGVAAGGLCGEWMFPAPAREPHYSQYYGPRALPRAVAAPPDFVAREASLVCTTPGTVQGVAQWREVARIDLV